MIRLGIEEEVFVLEGEHITLDGLFTLARLLRKNPRFYYTHTASNIARGKDLQQSLLASVEISTSPHENVEDLIAELEYLRKDFSASCPGTIVAAGMLPHLPNAPTIVAALQVHVSGVSEETAYKTFLYFAPVLSLLTANSPAVGGRYIGLSARILNCPFIGVPGSDRFERFGDVIISRRLGTLEFRLFDPCPQIDKVRSLSTAIYELARNASLLNKDFNPQKYAAIRKEAATRGTDAQEVKNIAEELSELTGVPLDKFRNPPALKTWRMFSNSGTLSYLEMDSEYRRSVKFTGKRLPYTLRAAEGIFCYYLPRVPFTLYKYLKEHGHI